MSIVDPYDKRQEEQDRVSDDAQADANRRALDVPGVVAGAGLFSAGFGDMFSASFGRFGRLRAQNRKVHGAERETA
jgi:hypothetical protein